MIVHESQRSISYVDVVTRLSAALTYVPGVRPAAPPYDAPHGAHIGHGVAISAQGTSVEVRCYVVVDPVVAPSVVAQSLQINALVTTLCERMNLPDVTVFVVVSDVQTQGSHA
jgi:hypothetical protein